jgi:Na+/proline symporter
VVAAIFAAAMSSSLNSISATAVSDLYRPLFPGRADRHYLSVSRWLTVAAGAAQIGVALAIRHQTRSALDAALSVASILNGPVLGVFLLGAFSRRAGTAAAFAGMAAGLVAVVAVWRLTPVAWPWYTLVGSVTTLAVGSFLGSLRPARRERIA